MPFVSCASVKSAFCRSAHLFKPEKMCYTGRELQKGGKLVCPPSKGWKRPSIPSARPTTTGGPATRWSFTRICSPAARSGRGAAPSRSGSEPGRRRRPSSTPAVPSLPSSWGTGSRPLCGRSSPGGTCGSSTPASRRQACRAGALTWSTQPRPSIGSRRNSATGRSSAF